MANELMLNAQTFCNGLALHQGAARQTTFAAPFAMHVSKMCKIASCAHLSLCVFTCGPRIFGVRHHGGFENMATLKPPQLSVVSISS